MYRGLGEIAVAIGFGPMMLLGAYVVQTGGALSWEPFVASIPVALLVALILYVNEIPDRRGDARAGKRTLPVRFSRQVVISGYNVAAAAAYVALVVGVVAGILPVPTLLMLLTIPLARRVSRGLAPNYDNPYGLMAIMGMNVQLHLMAGLLLLAGYVVVLVAGVVAPSVDLVPGLSRRQRPIRSSCSSRPRRISSSSASRTTSRDGLTVTSLPRRSATGLIWRLPRSRSLSDLPTHARAAAA